MAKKAKKTTGSKARKLAGKKMGTVKPLSRVPNPVGPIDG